MNTPIRLALTMGDPAGIGPEIIVKAAHQMRDLVAQGRIELKVLGSAQALAQAASLLQMKAQGSPVLAPLSTSAQALPLRGLTASGQAGDGQAVQARLAWVAAGTDVYHFAVYAARITPEMAEPFFDGVKAR